MDQPTNPCVGLRPCDAEYLDKCLSQARSFQPKWLQSLFLGSEKIGLISDVQATALVRWLPLKAIPQGWQWQADSLTPNERSSQLRIAAESLRDAGLISGWRSEEYASWGSVESPGGVENSELFRLERAAFRYFGFRSHAVHINGFTPTGLVWCARRALTKPTDPGKLDNLAAGGIQAGETILTCAWRELFEEAGLRSTSLASMTLVGSVLTERLEPEGWHSETLHVFNAVLKSDNQPQNYDGEVESFKCVSLSEAVEDMRRGHWSFDAVCAMALGSAKLRNLFGGAYSSLAS